MFLYRLRKSDATPNAGCGPLSSLKRWILHNLEKLHWTVALMLKIVQLRTTFCKSIQNHISLDVIHTFPSFMAELRKEQDVLIQHSGNFVKLFVFPEYLDMKYKRGITLSWKRLKRCKEYNGKIKSTSSKYLEASFVQTKRPISDFIMTEESDYSKAEIWLAKILFLLPQIPDWDGKETEVHSHCIWTCSTFERNRPYHWLGQCKIFYICQKCLQNHEIGSNRSCDECRRVIWVRAFTLIDGYCTLCKSKSSCSHYFWKTSMGSSFTHYQSTLQPLHSRVPGDELKKKI